MSASDTTPRRKMIEVALPLEAINSESAREKSIRFGHPSTLHLWWARRPLAACRAILFSQLVDDPSSWPDLFPGEKEQDRERQRLFRIIEELVKWDNSGNSVVLEAARLEIARSIARGRTSEGNANHRDHEILSDGVVPKEVSSYLADVAPPIHDPFSGGGSIPLEAHRLGLPVIATDLNPIPVLISTALVDLPSRFLGRPPVSADDSLNASGAWAGSTGLAHDVEFYGDWVREQAKEQIGHIYGEETEREGVIAWIWARTAPSPDPAFAGVQVPLVTSFWLSKRKGQEAWLEPTVDKAGKSWSFKVRTGRPDDPERVANGTKVGRGNFACLLSGTVMTSAYLREQAQSGEFEARMIAVVRQVGRKRAYSEPTDAMMKDADVPVPDSAPDTNLPEQALGFRVQNYGMKKHSDLFTPRQLVALTTLCDLVNRVRAHVAEDARKAGWKDDGLGLEDGGTGASAYGDAVAVYLALGVGRLSDMCNSLCMWENSRAQVRHLFTRNAIPMLWDFAEPNIFSGTGGDYGVSLGSIVRVIKQLGVGSGGVEVGQWDASKKFDYRGAAPVFSTDPPYYDNVPYADLSDFFYVWLRKCLREVLPTVFQTMLVPKADELVAEPFRHGGRDEADAFFLDGMSRVLSNVRSASSSGAPAAVYYAFKQSETRDGGTSSTGWETFLEAVLAAGLTVVGTWPLRTELGNRIRGQGANALASSVVLVCRARASDAGQISRGDFRRLLKRDLPNALSALHKGNVAPVDMAQAAIGPGMALFSSHERVIEADGSMMRVRSALQLINEVVDEVSGEEEGAFDRDTRFAATWFETHGYEEGTFGEADTLAKARNVSVEGVEEAGVLRSAAGKVRLFRRDELPSDWDPGTDERLTVWESVQYLIRRLEEHGEEAAALLLGQLGPIGEQARNLAYRLYTICERRGWAEEAQAYNGLVLAWRDLEKLGAESGSTGESASQKELFD